MAKRACVKNIIIYPLLIINNNLFNNSINVSLFWLCCEVLQCVSVFGCCNAVRLYIWEDGGGLAPFSHRSLSALLVTVVYSDKTRCGWGLI